MRESCTSGSARGARGNSRPYRNRREFITFLGSAAVAWPLSARAQQPAMPTIGFLNVASPNLYATRLRAFHQGLGQMGYIEGRNVAVEYPSPEGHYDRLPPFPP